YLLGGDGPFTSDDHDGMKQLTSPSYSARELVKWFFDMPYNNPDKPLASIALLISERNVPPFTHPKATNASAVGPATMANASAAINEWKDRGDNDPNNLMLFYFCGHGIAQGPEVSLLCSDYGADKNAPLNAAIHFTAFHQGMDGCKAAYQCYFIDACRTSSDTLIESYKFAGLPIIQSKGDARRNLPPRQAPVFYSTLSGEAAYGRPNLPTFYTESLINGLNGTGASDRDGSWCIYTTELNTAVGTAVSSMGRQVQYPTTGNLTSFVLHHLKSSPIVPVTIGCNPKTNNQSWTMLYRQGGIELDRRPPALEDWQTKVATGSYQFIALDAGDEIGTNPPERYVGPPYRVIRIPS
ncbi:MAG: caspase family protein, partial [Chromatiales bacterium]|nr:caspase family protein [Chromatiales bacterium]